MKLTFATNNKHKLEEVQAILGINFELAGLEDIGCTEEVPETGNTLEANALEKARYIYEKYNTNCFADDTGLEIDYLNGAPGVYSARYAGEQKNPADNVKKVLSEMQNANNRKARFRCVIALILEGKEYFFEGIVNGEMLNEPTGKAGFGYDPIFQPDGYDCSFAEMPLDKKNKISHRGRAVEKLIAFFKS
ncbi:MAG: non-canonical purine NTP pyrophosphatase [Bacteroidetes bacterium RIFOXYA12_FULL_35_11]|nr:MAG: non-canonical purine NTP pyrophosphatase [Bacteroidetes bacterium GWF2_35_48]OFY75976.1 MAG: non-canonical purine NTP pyrophosphatase [Bacteroidetes bacterium RIFOXYA12_FULL_35_11]OFY93585.1 MAG: non-canonical purine NTP pyrophosphatase [Bacteroidetes bacterium RIFOXYC12_FULL_35_7]HBX53681.1 non-canonical purine NTP pyrophosphatase [Bacteroidales bacterium]